jgi:hypothetical protein
MAPTWIRVRDRDTGHEYDLHEESPLLGTAVVTVIEGYPEHSSSSAQPRPPKYRVDKAGQPITPAAVDGEHEPAVTDDAAKTEGDEPPAVSGDNDQAPEPAPPSDEPPPETDVPAGDQQTDGDAPPADDQTTAGTSAKKRRSH